MTQIDTDKIERKWRLIEILSGTLLLKHPTYAVVDVGGVGYGLHISLATYNKLPDSPAKIKLFAHLMIRDEQLILYGFYTSEERELFCSLVKISGIGPKIALRIISTISVDEFRLAIEGENIHLLSGIRGIGKKTAARLILELKDSLVKMLSTSEEDLQRKKVVEEATLALTSLGYTSKEVATVMERILKDAMTKLNLPELVKMALSHL